MPILVRCDCGKQLKAKDELAGRRVKCPGCGAVLTVPDIDEPAPNRPSAPKAEPPRRPKARSGAREEYDEEEEEQEEDEDEEEEVERPRRRRRKARRPSRSGLSRHDLYYVAIYQKVLLLCILCNIGAAVAYAALPPELKFVVALGSIGISVVATVFVFLLALKVYSVGAGIAMGIVTLIPCIGLITLLIINSKATSVLKGGGYSVGLLGASLSQFR
jgi:hypothetical protein